MDNIWHKVVTQLLELSLIIELGGFPAEEVSLSRERIQVFGKVRRCRAHETHGVGWLLLSGIDVQWWAEGKLWAIGEQLKTRYEGQRGLLQRPATDQGRKMQKTKFSIKYLPSFRDN